MISLSLKWNGSKKRFEILKAFLWWYSKRTKVASKDKCTCIHEIISFMISWFRIRKKKKTGSRSDRKKPGSGIFDNQEKTILLYSHLFSSSLSMFNGKKYLEIVILRFLLQYPNPIERPRSESVIDQKNVFLHIIVKMFFHIICTSDFTYFSLCQFKLYILYI